MGAAAKRKQNKKDLAAEPPSKVNIIRFILS
jgi:hypothetical protein